ncbi:MULTISPECIES: glycerophosphodiester phosphodiesterase family protein [unclassified Arenibacter]|uniref:glycerophosphodiester phosphodiesterase family protein n=1 Tax=unclassified Arenibacter TaxID=2615047 RepID=UPI000E34D7D7|nr:MULTISPECIES: glycerophosphodiester phosphodiesterase family protein [unclassified Arenibacter]MCM4164203.1 glycerophosphodiester phosphodiesterase [Arenibacter sp. A80]RFT55999.1 glycerophosphodiester phosphodiesterase [Arenibacter sp. P308M17]
MKSSLYPTWNKTICILFLLLGLSSLAQETKLEHILNDYTNHPERVLVAAHRATNPNYPENSLAAIAESIRIGVDIVEIDIRKSKDGELVIMHDRTIDRTTNGTGKIDDFTLAELKAFRLQFGNDITDEQIPTFEEVLQLTKGKMLLDVDFKLEGEASVRQTFALIEKYGMEDQILFFLYDYPETTQYQKLNKDIKIMPRAYSRKDIRAIRKLDDISIIHIDESYYKDRTMRRLIKSGYRVWINALGKYDSMEGQEKNSGFDALMSHKYVNVVQTDLPEELLNYLRAKKLHR